MARFTRRDALGVGIGALAGTTLLDSRSLRAQIAVKDVAAPKFEIENGASLRVLRPAKFVAPDEELFLANTARFTEKTGVAVKVDFAGWEDLRPQTAVSANTGAGADIIIGWADDPHLYASVLSPLDDLAVYLGEKYGGWYPLAEKYGKLHGTDTWVAIPMGGSGGPCVYRESWVREAGFDGVPKDLDGFLDLCRKLKANGHPPGFALGNAVGDGNAFCSWLVWSHGGAMTDEAGQVTINSKETIEALKYGKALYETFISGTLSWLDTNNNKALTAGEIGLTQNGVSLYFSIKNNKDAAIAALAADLNHARMPVGPVGRSTETALVINAMLFKHSDYQNAAKEYLRFMMEEAQYDPWLQACLGYWSQPLKAYAQSAVWNSDPKVAVYQQTMESALWYGYAGPITEASGAVNADYVLVQMVSSVCAGQATPEEAAAEAERRAKRYYKA
jgi:multiple sugar transport system substrate-binding protein